MIIDKVFSKEIIETISFKIENSKKKTAIPVQLDIKNIPENFIELIIAGSAVKSGKNIIWVNKENTDLDKLKIKLEKWFEIFSKQIKIITYTLPFSDPYISNQINHNFYIEKNDLIKTINEGKQAVIITNIAIFTIY